MEFQFDINSSSPSNPPPPAPTGDALSVLMNQLLEVQREQLTQLRQLAQSMDHGARWRNLVSRWRQEFPEMPDAARQALPVLEKAYGSILARLVEELRDAGPEALDSDFALQEFLDRYGMRLSQLSHILNLVSPLADQNTSKG